MLWLILRREFKVPFCLKIPSLLNIAYLYLAVTSLVLLYNL